MCSVLSHTRTERSTSSARVCRMGNPAVNMVPSVSNKRRVSSMFSSPLVHFVEHKWPGRVSKMTAYVTFVW